jgi:hypothetical protein
LRLYVNSWYPAWLDGRKPVSDRHVYVEWFEIRRPWDSCRPTELKWPKGTR